MNMTVNDMQKSLKEMVRCHPESKNLPLEICSGPVKRLKRLLHARPSFPFICINSKNFEVEAVCYGYDDLKDMQDNALSAPKKYNTF